jgi:hypothetical protein
VKVKKNDNETFLPWNTKIKNYKNEMEETSLVIWPCEHLYEKTDIKLLMTGKINNFDGINLIYSSTK